MPAPPVLCGRRTRRSPPGRLERADRGRISEPSCLVRPVDVKVRTVEQEIARLATGAQGVAARAELLEAGITRQEIAHRIRIGALIVEFRGVYRMGHRAPSVEARYLAAVKACGAGARLSGLAAAHLLGLVRGAVPPPEVTAPTERRVRGVKTHRSRTMDPRDGTRWRGIPVTTVPRTLVELSSVLSLDALARAFHEAGIRHRTTPAQVEAALERPGSRS